MTTYNATPGHPISGITLSAGDFAGVSSGGSATSVTLENESAIYIYSGGIASFTVLSGGLEYVSSGGVASGSVVSGGTEVVYSGGSASFAVVSGNGSEDIYLGGDANSTTVIGGIQGIYRGGVASGAVVVSDGGEYVYSGGIASATVVKNGGTQFVFSMGVASGAVISGGGTVVVNQGGTVSFAVVSPGGAIDFPGLPYSGGSATIAGFDVLTVVEGNASATLQLAGLYKGESFVTSEEPDPNDGTVVTLVEAPRTLLWTGAANTNFAVAANWDDLTNAEDAAANQPNAADTVEFLTSGGTVAGTGTVSALEFGGTAAWNVTSAAHLTAISSITVGAGGAGSVTINGGAIVNGTGASDDISGTSGAGASVTVDGAGSTWRSAGELIVGDSGTGSLTISGSGSLSATAAGSLPAMALGAGAAGTGSLSVTGAGSRAAMTGQLNVGEAGDGSLTISDQGTVQTGNDPLLDPAEGLDIAQLPGASGQVTVTGANSLLINTGRFVVGDAGLGSLSIEAGGTVITAPGTGSNLPGLAIANTASADGSMVNLVGTGSNLQVTGLLDVGVDGSGGLSISDGASVTAGTLDAGNIISAVANISVTDADLTVAGAATVAGDGTGVLSILSGATFSAASLTIGSQGDSSGALVVSGEGSVVNISGDLNIGTAHGTGDLTIGPGATVNALVVNLQGEVVLENGELDPAVNLINQDQTAGGSGTIAAGDIVDEGVIQAGGSEPSQKLLVVAGTVLGGGPWTINGAAQALANGDVGVLQINAGGTLELTGPVLNAASTTFTDDVTPRSTYTANDSVVDVNFEDATGVLKLDDIGGFAGTIVSFREGDSFVITGGTLSNLGVTGGDTLTVSDSGNGGIDNLIFSSGINAAGFSIVNGNTIQVACFAAGTRIETETGLMAVEALRVGHQAVTHDGTCEPIVWIGQRTVNCERHPKPETVWPIRVARGAFRRNVPVRDLYLSPDHALFVNGVFIPVKLLVNGASIAQVKRDRITYFHVELPRHAVILAEGQTVESYLDLDDRADFANGGETIRLFPDFAARHAAMTWETKAAAPLVMAGEKLTAARAMIVGGGNVRVAG